MLTRTPLHLFEADERLRRLERQRSAGSLDPEAKRRHGAALRRSGRTGEAQRHEASDTVESLVPKLKDAHKDLEAWQAANPHGVGQPAPFLARNHLTRKLHGALRREGKGRKIGHVITHDGFENDPHSHLRLVSHALGGLSMRRKGGHGFLFGGGESAAYARARRGRRRLDTEMARLRAGEGSDQTQSTERGHAQALHKEFLNAGKFHYGDRFKPHPPTGRPDSVYQRIKEITPL